MKQPTKKIAENIRVIFSQDASESEIKLAATAVKQWSEVNSNHQDANTVTAQKCPAPAHIKSK